MDFKLLEHKSNLLTGVSLLISCPGQHSLSPFDTKVAEFEVIETSSDVIFFYL